jgi:glutathione peroxidase-family protein
MKERRFILVKVTNRCIFATQYNNLEMEERLNSEKAEK